MKRPNIIVYFSDQQRADSCGCYGQKLNVTPNLDEFAECSTIFKRAFTCQPVCGPMRACLQTGVYATQNGCYRNNIALKTNETTIAKLLNDNGYDTAYIGKWHLASNSQNDFKTKAVPEEYRGGYKYWRAADVLEFTSHGYDGFIYDDNNQRIDFKGYRADRINDFAIDYIENNNHDKPFFMFVSQLEPHHQNDHLRFESPKGSRKLFKGYEVPGDLKGKIGDWKIQFPSYLACCNRVDYNFGKLLETLKKNNLYKDTVIIYTSDHGCHFRTRNSEYKRTCHESSIHVPLIIGGGAFSGKNERDDLVSLIDLPSTILDVAGIDIPENFMGYSLCSEYTRKDVYIQISESQIGRAIRTDKWMYSVSAPNSDNAYSDKYTEEILYDLENDIFENNNLIKNEEYQEIKTMLRNRLIEYMKSAEEPYTEILSV